MAKPGVMFYFDIRPCIKRLTIEEKGKLFEAILDYGEFGTVPEVAGALGIAWDFIQPNLDRDTERYERQVEQKQYAAFVREVKKKGVAIPSIDTWRGLSDIEKQRLLSADIGRYPTNNLQSTTNNLQTTASTVDNKESVADKPPTRHKFGEYKNVLLSDDEIEKLRTDIPDYLQLIEKLSEYIASTGKRYKSHYATLRSWSRRDKSDRAHVGNLSQMPDYGGDENCSL